MKLVCFFMAMLVYRSTSWGISQISPCFASFDISITTIRHQGWRDGGLRSSGSCEREEEKRKEATRTSWSSFRTGWASRQHALQTNFVFEKSRGLNHLNHNSTSICCLIFVWRVTLKTERCAAYCLLAFFVHVTWYSPGLPRLALVELVPSVGVSWLSNLPARLFILILGMHLIFIARDTQVNVGGNKHGKGRT